MFEALDGTPLPRHPQSFFLYLLDCGVSVEDYTKKLKEAYGAYPSYKLGAYNNIWPDELAAYLAACRFSGTQPH